MSSRSVCTACRKPMSAGAVRCVYCGAFRGSGSGDAPKTTRTPNYREAAARPAPPPPAAKPPPAPPKPPPPEPEPAIGLTDGLFLPHPRARGIMRGVEWLAIVLELPLLAASLIGVGVLSFRMQLAALRNGDGLDWDASDATWRILALGSGFGVLIALLARHRHLTITTVAIVLGSQVAALVLRLAIRAAITARR